MDEEGLDEQELQDQLSRLEDTIEEQNNVLDNVQTTLSELLHKRGTMAQEIQPRRARLQEIKELLGRFDLLDQHYQTDLKRLEAVHESGSLFVHLERDACPLCGSTSGDQHLDSECDGNTEAVIQAASAEINKIGTLRHELSNTNQSLLIAEARIIEELPSLEREYQRIDDELSQIATPAVSINRASYNQVVVKKAEVVGSLDKFKRFEQLNRPVFAGGSIS